MISDVSVRKLIKSVKVIDPDKSESVQDAKTEANLAGKVTPLEFLYEKELSRD